jgi:hypothetical protein
MELRDMGGTLVGPVVELNLPANGQISRSGNEILPQIPEEFRGILRVTASSPVTVAGLRGILNERGEVLITAMPVWNDLIPPVGTESNFAYVLSGGGYDAKFVIVSPTPASGDTGTLWIVNKDGSVTETLQKTP